MVLPGCCLAIISKNAVNQLIEMPAMLLIISPLLRLAALAVLSFCTPFKKTDIIKTGLSCFYAR